MISLATARKLYTAGLSWTPALHDLFGVPDRGMDDRVFVISDISVDIELLKGQSVVTFNGTAEWALDYELVAELVWLPTEAQLRQALERLLSSEPQPRLVLVCTPEGYLCEIPLRGQSLTFRASEASEAYGAALLHVLQASR
jgi:hypothetical protein